MAGASMNAIKSRIKSVESTRQITKAMELVAISKLRRAKERAEGSRPYHKLLWETTFRVMNSTSVENPFTEKRTVNNTCYIVIAGDRGLAGGYNANIFRMTRSLWKNENHCVLPIGKKAVDYYSRKGENLLSGAFSTAANITTDDCVAITALVCDLYKTGKIDRVVLVYTSFVSMLQQQTVCEDLLPFKKEEAKEAFNKEPITDDDDTVIIEYLMPLYLSGILSSAVDESLASECASRRNAMNSANKNADEIISKLQLHYNRARQAAITQEITEIVSGAEAL